MKRRLGAIVMTSAVLAGAAAPSGSLAQAHDPAPATVDERLGCGMMFLSIDEITRAFPALGQGFGGSNREGATAMMRVMAISGAQAYNAAFAEATAQGAKPSDIHRRAIAYIGQRFQTVKELKSKESRAQATALFNRCSTVVAASAS